MIGKDTSGKSSSREQWFLESYVLDFWGRMCLGGPKPEQIPCQDEEKQLHLAGNFYAVPKNRIPMKWTEAFGRGAQWNAQVRYFEQKMVKFVVPLVAAVLCTLFVATGSMVASSTKGIESWNNKRKAENAAEEAREYAAKREVLKKEWATDIASYSAQKCLDEVTALRIRKTNEAVDRYAVLEAGCRDKRDDIKTVAQTWPLEKCVAFAKEGTEQVKEGGTDTWLDSVVFQEACYAKHGAALQDRLN